MDNIDQARMVSSFFTNEIRGALYGSDGSYPLNQLQDSQIVFYSNFKTQGLVVARVRYYVSGDVLYKGVTLPSGSPAVYNLSSEKVTSVATGIANDSSPAFFYYDGDSNLLSQPVNINQVRYVKINLLVLNNLSPSSTNVFSISAGAAIRFLKDNLRN